MKPTQVRLSRRNFLLAAGTGSAAAAAAAIVAKKQMDGTTPKDRNIESGTGYRLTEHVQNYYRTAKI